MLDKPPVVAYMSPIDISAIVRVEPDGKEDPGVRTIRRTVAAHPGEPERRTEARLRDHARRRAGHWPADGCRHPLRGTRPARGAGPHRTTATGGPTPAVSPHGGRRVEP